MMFKKTVALILLLLMLIPVFCSCSNRADNTVSSAETYDGKKIGVLTGSVFDTVASKNLKNPNICYYNSNADLAIALDKGKIDAYINDEPVWRVLTNEYPNQKSVKLFSNEDYAFGFKKNDEKSAVLCKQMNEFLKKCRDDGTLKETDEKWFGTDESVKTVDMSGLTAENGTLTFATTTDIGAPFAYIKDNRFAGYDVDIAVKFCREYGYGINITNSNFEGMMSSVTSGKGDFFAACVTVTPERSESILFSDADYIGGTVLVAKSDNTAEQITSTEQLNGLKVGVQTGTMFDSAAAEYLPESKTIYFNTGSDLAVALEKGKIDSYLIDEPIARLLFKEYPRQRILKILRDESYAWVMSKKKTASEKLCGEINEFFKKCSEDGTFEEIDSIWFGTDTQKQKIDYGNLTAENGTLSLAICTSVGKPFCYMQDNEFAGYDLDCAVRFCREYGYGLKITDYDIPGFFTCLASGKCDFGACCVSVTEERKETMLFSDPNYKGGVALVVNGAYSVTENEEADFFSSIKDSFNKTFIREARYKLFLSGIGTTLLIVLLSMIFGTLIGFTVYLIYYRTGKIFRTPVNIFMQINENTPVVVILMILYYIIFGKVDISGIIVSVIGFTLIFAGSVIGVMKVGVGAVDKGQREAALALGYTENKAFLRIILPQAAVHFLPGYKNAIIQLIKGTAIVGYIAVQDLTKVSDIVRSRTYEAFFPLIITAIIYYLTAIIMSVLVKRIEIHINPASRKKSDG